MGFITSNTKYYVPTCLPTQVDRYFFEYKVGRRCSLLEARTTRCFPKGKAGSKPALKAGQQGRIVNLSGANVFRTLSI